MQRITKYLFRFGWSEC